MCRSNQVAAEALPVTTTSPSTQGNSPPEMRRVRPSRRPQPKAGAASDMEGNVRVGVYFRASTAREDVGQPRASAAQVNSYIERMQGQQKWTVVRVAEDLDISGRSVARAGIKELMAMIREGAIRRSLPAVTAASAGTSSRPSLTSTRLSPSADKLAQARCGDEARHGQGPRADRARHARQDRADQPPLEPAGAHNVHAAGH
jgi:hypothetical protein